MSGKSFFVDLTKCTACRGCQVACKQWHKLPAEKTKNVGSHQNPQDLSFITYKLVRFNEVEIGGSLKWLFTPDQCRHCLEPPCKDMMGADDERAVRVDPDTGAVLYTDFTRKVMDQPAEDLCPYSIPRRDSESGLWSKCDFCIDRVHNGLLPACVQSCPTGAMNFGDREDMLAMANERLAVVKKKYPEASLADADAVRVIFLCAYDTTNYADNVVAEATTPTLKNRRQLFASLSRPVRLG